MTGAEHFERAEQLAAVATVLVEGGEPDRARARHLTALAQVHATLAVAAATRVGNAPTTLVGAWAS